MLEVVVVLCHGTFVIKRQLKVVLRQLLLAAIFCYGRTKLYNKFYAAIICQMQLERF